MLITIMCVCVCVCVCVCYPIFSGHQTCGRTSLGHTQEEGYTGFFHLPSAVLAFIFIAGRIQASLSLVDRDFEFCVPTNQSFSSVKVVFSGWQLIR